MNEFWMLIGFENLDKVDEMLGKNIFHFVTPTGMAMLFIFKTDWMLNAELNKQLYVEVDTNAL